MNANELADEVMEHYRASLPRGFNVNWMEETATMLRQQQEEIKDLKQQVAFLEDWRDTWRPFLKAIMGKVNEK